MADQSGSVGLYRVRRPVGRKAQEGTRVTVPRWETIQHWVINDRPATEKRDGGNWIGVPGTENLQPNVDYRLAISWGPRPRTHAAENWLEHVQLRVEFEGWRIGSSNRFQDSIQFYVDNSYAQPTSPGWRIHINYPPENRFDPDRVAVTDYAYFRVTTERDRAWKMRYNIGLYGSVQQARWRRVQAQ